MSEYWIQQDGSVNPFDDCVQYSFRSFLESSGLLAQLINNFKSQYPGLELHVYQNEYRIAIKSIRLPRELRNQGLGTKIIKSIQDYAQTVGLPIVLIPQPESRMKAKLHRFYKNLGFTPNVGRKIDYALSSFTGGDWLWKPKKKL